MSPWGLGSGLGRDVQVGPTANIIIIIIITRSFLITDFLWDDSEQIFPLGVMDLAVTSLR